MTTGSNQIRSSRNGRYTLLDFRDRVELHLGGPRPIDGPQIRRSDRANIEREVGDQDVVAVEDEAIRPEKTDGRAVLSIPPKSPSLAITRPCFGSSTMISLD